MSAYANPQNHTAQAAALGQLEGLAGTLRGLETALAQEKERSAKLTAELTAATATHEQSKKEVLSRNRALELEHEKLKAALSLHQDNDQKVSQQYRALHSEYLKIRDELNQYRAAWAEVLQREKEAKLIIIEGDKSRERIRELEALLDRSDREQLEYRKRIEQLERHGKSYQDELQSTLVRLHSAEGKFSELSKELDAFRASRRSMEEEITKIEASLQERMQWSLLKEREKLRAELERDAALEREQARDSFHELRAQLDGEVSRLSQALSREERQAQQLSAAMITEKVRHENELIALQRELVSVYQTVAGRVDPEVASLLQSQHERIAQLRSQSLTIAQPDAGI